MNKVAIIGRLVRDPDIRYAGNGSDAKCIGSFTVAVDRKKTANGDKEADFINCVAFGKQGEFAEKYLFQGTKVAIVGRIQTGSYTNKDGHKVYTTDVVAEEIEFAESKKQEAPKQERKEVPKEQVNEGFMDISDGASEEGLPFC